MTAGLAWSAISDLFVSLDCSTQFTTQALLNAGVFLGSVICGRTLCTSKIHGNQARLTSRTAIKALQLSCDKIPDDVFAATCSALSETHRQTKLILLTVRSINPLRWAWLVYALYYRAWNGVEDTDFAESNLRITNIKLTRADVDSIEAALEYGYPIESPQRDLVYGFVDIHDGTPLWPRGCPEAGSNGLIASSQVRCRACYDPTNCDFVEILVPGCRICEARTGGATVFTPVSK